MTTSQLTPTQHAILAHAIEHTDGQIEWFPDNIKGGARKKVLTDFSTAPWSRRMARAGALPPRVTTHSGWRVLRHRTRLKQ